MVCCQITLKYGKVFWMNKFGLERFGFLVGFGKGDLKKFHFDSVSNGF